MLIFKRMDGISISNFQQSTFSKLGNLGANSGTPRKQLFVVFKFYYDFVEADAERKSLLNW